MKKSWIVGVLCALGLWAVTYEYLSTPADAQIGVAPVRQQYTEYDQLIPGPNTDTFWTPEMRGSNLLLHVDADTLQVTLYSPRNVAPGVASDSTKITVYGPVAVQYHLLTSDVIRVEMGAADGTVAVIR